MKTRIIFIIILLIGALLRILYSLDLPLDGEEVGVATLQATGQAKQYSQKLPDVITPIDSIRNFIRYSPDHSAIDVFQSLRYAGMHPPFYYLLLHYIIKFFGNSAIILRAISFFASLLSIWYLYRLGKALFNEKIGLYAAAFLAFSGYGIWLGTYVRPYSLIMLLSLVSTYQAYHLSISKAVSFRNINLYLYILTVTLGLYTIYHFIFVFIFQIALILLTNFRNKNTIIPTLFIITLVFLCFSAWIPSLRTQMNVVSKGHYYFHENVDIFHFIGDAASINSVRYFQLNSFLLKSIIALIYASITTVITI